ncbi:p53-like transcription factor [Coemansia reversa NRRL 1564]|uniref:p53-like transcription factor n=1 Tax=Coemansia reversa (strain ATCC 12441 / NRRL 1564) TaxID=763665 RepID=A0A2G5B6X4_COERN|nr:p53-like transcription factor [Coemansia reversa NRRL 1564]|eukprot:PIA14765.1 p53-like transcription factor [Coemansia reversa NRRL 1564]
MPQEGQQQPRAFFGKAQQHCELYSGDKTTQYIACLSPQVDRGFFLANEDWTCYRRNYFQVSCTFSLVGAVPASGGTAAINGSTATGCVAVVNGVMHRVTRFLIGLSAQVLEDGKIVELVQHTPKRDKGPQMTPQPQPALPTDIAAQNGSTGSNTVCFERIQFKTATANNGKRRAAQQYYMLEVLLLADCENGGRILVASSTSAPIVVRGRSPGHYADATMHHRTVSSNDAHELQQHTEMQQDDSENSAAVAAAIAAAAGYDFSANSMVQALSRIGAPAPHPQEILDRAQTMTASASLPGLQSSHSGIADTLPSDTLPADLSFIAATMADSTGNTASQHAHLLDIHPPPTPSDPSSDMSLL